MSSVEYRISNVECLCANFTHIHVYRYIRLFTIQTMTVMFIDIFQKYTCPFVLIGFMYVSLLRRYVIVPWEQRNIVVHQKYELYIIVYISDDHRTNEHCCASEIQIIHYCIYSWWSENKRTLLCIRNTNYTLLYI